MFHRVRYKIDSYCIDARQTAGPKKAKTVILIHGIGVSGNYFMPFACVLSRFYNVHVLDMPGYGKTPKPSHPLAPYEQADVLAGYIHKAGLANAIIVGQSMGCQTAAQFALRHPLYCEKLLLIGPTVNKWERRLFMQAFRLFIDTFREPLKMNLVIVRDYFQMGITSYLITSRYMITDHIEETLGQVTMPVCIVRGGKDGIAPKRWVNYLGKITKNAEVHHVSGGPHNVQFSDPKGLFAVCEDFLKR
jgi:pimeloyl-ACP methyl ester carboxylesterase